MSKVINQISSVYLILFILLGVSSCKKSEIEPENIFTKIYSDSNSDISYYPLDLKQVQDGGYFVLAATAIDTTRTWLNVYIAKLDKEGELVWGTELESPYVSPVSEIVVLGGEYFIYTMDDIALTTHILKIDDGSQSATHVASLPEVVYPLSVSKTPDNGFLLLGYDRVSRSSTINKIDASFNLTWQTPFNVNEDAEDILVKHMVRTGKNQPFFTGTIGANSASHYYVNGLFNYTLSLIFVNSNSGEMTGVAQGYRFDGGSSSLLDLGNGSFALSRYNYDTHFILPTTPVELASITHISDLGGAQLNEIAPDAETRSEIMNINGEEAVVFATNTNNNQVVIYAYTLGTNELILKKYLGFSNPVKIANMIQTTDEGIGILVQTMVAGRFKRMGFYKLPKEHLVPE